MCSIKPVPYNPLFPCPFCLMEGNSKGDLASQRLEMAEPLILRGPK